MSQNVKEPAKPERRDGVSEHVTSPVREGMNPEVEYPLFFYYVTYDSVTVREQTDQAIDMLYDCIQEKSLLH